MDAVRLFDLAEERVRVLALLNRSLSQLGHVQQASGVGEDLKEFALYVNSQPRYFKPRLWD